MKIHAKNAEKNMASKRNPCMDSSYNISSLSPLNAHRDIEESINCRHYRCGLSGLFPRNPGAKVKPCC